MTIREMRNKLGDTQAEFSRRYNIPFRTIQNWETGARNPSEYILSLLETNVKDDLINRKTIVLPEYDPHKIDLPKRKDYVSSFSWLKAVHNEIGDNIVFALDSALMCQNYFLGRDNEYLVWIYGDDFINEYNGVVQLSTEINDFYVLEKDGILFTDFDRTLMDSISNESIVDMQGITEALSKYYYLHNESFNDLTIMPNQIERFESLALDAIHYYDA